MHHQRRVSVSEVEGKKHDRMKFRQKASEMWTEVKNRSSTVIDNNTSSKMLDPDLGEQLLHTVQQRIASTAATILPSYTEDSLARSSGIIPGAAAATVFIVFLLALYAVLWKCMTPPPPQRKHRKVRVRVQQKTRV